MLSENRTENRSAVADTLSSARTKEPPSLVLADDISTTSETVSTPAANSMNVRWPLLPRPRGPLSSAVISAFRREPGTLGVTPPVSGFDALSDDDFSLALYLCYEIHYRGVTNNNWEWDPDLLTFRAELDFVRRLHRSNLFFPLTWPRRSMRRLEHRPGHRCPPISSRLEHWINSESFASIDPRIS